MPIDLAGKVAVITGASGGIGSAIARELDRRGCRCVAAGRDGARLAEVVCQLTSGVAFDDCDLRDSRRVEALFEFVLDRHATVDIVVAAAGIGRGSASGRAIADPVATLALEDWDEVIDTNLRGTFLTCRAAARRMVKQRSGQIVNISSARAALRGQPCAAAYSASKMAGLAMLQSLAEEVAPFGVRVMSVLPDAVETSLIAATRLGRRGMMSPADIGCFVADLLSLPWDAVLDAPLLAPCGFQPRRRPGVVRSA